VSLSLAISPSSQRAVLIEFIENGSVKDQSWNAKTSERSFDEFIYDAQGGVAMTFFGKTWGDR
jgi:hypothetical protein